MKKFIQYSSFLVFLFFSQRVIAQNNDAQDSIVQLYGVIMTADSLRAIPLASIVVEDKGRGTLTNDDGVFSIVVLKGDRIRFSCIGFKDKEIIIPNSISGNQYSVIQLMVNDTNYLPATIIRARPTSSQFEREFLNTHVPDDQLEVARKNTDEATRRALITILPQDGREAVSMHLQQEAQKYYYKGQQPPINLFNPFAWAEFIQAWKRGDFRKKK